VAAAVTAADQKASFGDQMAKATLDASDQKAQFEGQMAEAKLAAGDMKTAFDKLTLDNTDQIAAFDSHMAQAEHDAARQQAGFDIRMAKAEHDAGGMKVGFWVTPLPSDFAFMFGISRCTDILPPYQVAFDKLTVDSAHQQASAAVAAATAADQQAGFDIRMAKAKQYAGGMKASHNANMDYLHSSHIQVPCSKSSL